MPLSRTARALSATAFTTLVLGTAATAATTTAASANSGAEVSPRTVAPGGSVTVSVTCASTGGHPPKTIDATSDAFEHGTVQLHRTGHAGDSGDSEGSGHSGHKEDPSRMDDPAGADDPAGVDDLAGVEDPLGVEDAAGMDDPAGDEDATGLDDEGPAVVEEPADAGDPGGRDDPAGKDEARGGLTYSGTARIAPAADFAEGGPDGAGKISEWRAEGVCPAAPGGEGKEWSASFTVSLGASHDRSHGTRVPHGVHAGEGGTFNDSTVALVSGGVLIAGALGAAVQKLRHRESSHNG
ncbi:hypothetical protein OG288_09645 [Streptomyces tauricus]|uniref:Gram-positive cocci surface proteins LPxTG domain-containing protein n=1 Tax=Streptomyces tauricus TaxID=68274 RepID=A0ABZ1JA93_9ACTN|nr:hypothetical protein [Streptomyces tauricus]